MEKKKNLNANIEKTRTMFLSLGLIIAIALIVSAFSYKSEKIIQIFDIGKIIDEEQIIITNTKEPDPPEPEQVNKKEIKTVISDVFKEVENETKIDTSIKIWTGEDPILETVNIDEPIKTTLIIASTMPKFPGGTNALRTFIARNVNYPTQAREIGIQGTVYLRFEVTKTGSIGKVEILKSIDPLLDKEAIRVIKKLPKFKAGINNGKKVNVWFSMPISFRLN